VFSSFVVIIILEYATYYYFWKEIIIGRLNITKVWRMPHLASCIIYLQYFASTAN